MVVDSNGESRVVQPSTPEPGTPGPAFGVPPAPTGTSVERGSNQEEQGARSSIEGHEVASDEPIDREAPRIPPASH